MLSLSAKVEAGLHQLAKEGITDFRAYLKDIVNRLERGGDIAGKVCSSAITELLFQVVLQNVGKEDFLASLESFDIDKPNIWDAFEENRHLFEKAAHSRADHFPHYHSLQWRIEASVASRVLHRHIAPFVTMNITLRDEKSGVLQNRALRATPTQLLHMTHVLEEALQEARSRRTRKLQKSLASTS